MRNSEKVLFAAAFFFMGMVAGFLLAPIKKGVYCGNYNGNRIQPPANEQPLPEDEDAIAF